MADGRTIKVEDDFVYVLEDSKEISGNEMASDHYALMQLYKRKHGDLENMNLS